jgi:hypothetical protein
VYKPPESSTLLSSMTARRAPAPRSRRPPRKDRLIQTRVPRDLEETLKREAERRRVTVSQLIRNLVEDTFQLVDGVVADVDQIVTDSVRLARSVRRSARRLTAGRGEERETVPPGSSDLAEVFAWSEVVLQRPAHCSSCGRRLGRGERGYVGLSQAAPAPRAWLCPACIAALREPSAGD